MAATSIGWCEAIRIRLPPVRPGEAVGRAEHGDVFEHRRQRGRFGLDESHWRMVDHIDGVGTVRAEHPVDLVDELAGGKVPWHRDAAEGIADHQVG